MSSRQNTLLASAHCTIWRLNYKWSLVSSSLRLLVFDYHTKSLHTSYTINGRNPYGNIISSHFLDCAWIWWESSTHNMGMNHIKPPTKHPLRRLEVVIANHEIDDGWGCISHKTNVENDQLLFVALFETSPIDMFQIYKLSVS